MKHRMLFTLAVLSLGLPILQAQTETKTTPTSAGQAASKEATPAAKPADTVKVTKTKMVIDLPIKGTFEATETTELSFHLDVWTGMNALSAVPHGKQVRKGDVLLTLDTEKIDKALKDAEYDQQLAEIAFKQAEEEMKFLEKTTPMDMANAENAKKYADEDYKKFLESDLAMLKRNTEFQMKSSQNFLKYAEEELKQLEKMYLADDIKENTEEIILKRQRDQVEMASNSFLNAQKRRDELFQFDLPRRELSAKESNIRSQIAYEKAKLAIPAAYKKAQISFEKTKLERSRSLERYDQLKKDREKMTLKAPVDGILYYGKCTKGQWTPAGPYESRFMKGGSSISNDEVVMTIIRSNNFIVRMNVEEKDFMSVSVGQAVKLTPTIDPEKKIRGIVDSVASIPTGGGYEVKIKVDSADKILPGMTCSGKIQLYSKLNALTVPTASTFVDEDDEDVHVVYLPGKDGKDPVKKPVKLGRKSGDKVEVLDGFSEGDAILKDKPAKK